MNEFETKIRAAFPGFDLTDPDSNLRFSHLNAKLDCAVCIEEREADYFLMTFDSEEWTHRIIAESVKELREMVTERAEFKIREAQREIAKWQKIADIYGTQTPVEAARTRRNAAWAAYTDKRKSGIDPQLLKEEWGEFILAETEYHKLLRDVKL